MGTHLLSTEESVVYGMIRDGASVKQISEEMGIPVSLIDRMAERIRVKIYGEEQTEKRERKLTERETKCVEMMQSGMTAKEIEQHFDFSRQRFHQICRRIKEKTGKNIYGEHKAMQSAEKYKQHVQEIEKYVSTHAEICLKTLFRDLSHIPTYIIIRHYGILRRDTPPGVQFVSARTKNKLERDKKIMDMWNTGVKSAEIAQSIGITVPSLMVHIVRMRREYGVDKVIYRKGGCRRCVKQSR